ncbi:LysR family transcriptional regulator [Neobacillus mesonae]|uniref:LysR family transcriptional regulator n=1 Tax=Neobacillus mesonae TaxID=1193713 RepID=UPI00203A986A|nr:LysR family transcriptional regulator [Neobacillus mesonae]MCM3571082.1 LysR family transcriptional regulator [Neobacillus mesonae]
MELRQIHYFSEIVKHGSFSKAAEALFISQPTISNVVKELEKELGSKLLIRTTRRFELTDAGRLLYKLSQTLSNTLIQFDEELDDIKSGLKGEIKMGVFTSVGTEILTKIIAEFYSLYPKINIIFIEDSAANLKNALLRGELDLAVINLPTHEELESFPFLKGDLRLLVHQDHVLANRENVKWADLKSEKYIMFREGFTVYDMIMWETNRLGFQPEIICETSQWKFILELVSFNLGIAILPQSTLTKILVKQKGINVLPLIDPVVHWEIGIAWPKESYVSLAARKWIGFLQEKLHMEWTESI